jgi:integrase
VLFEAVTGLVARDDRIPERPVFQGFTIERFRTAIARACRAAGVPSFSPHDLRHRRVSLLHLGGMPWARIGELVGHDDLVTTARTYTHVVADEANSITRACWALHRAQARTPAGDRDRRAYPCFRLT